MNQFCKILISYHKKDFLLKDEILTPIHAGRAKAYERGTSESLEWLLENAIGDDTGDNISEKNSSYNEMTSVYWAWKNYEAIGNPDWIGFMHYRRHFLFCGGEKSCYENEGIYPEYLDEIGYAPEKLRSMLENADFLTVKPQYRQSMYEHYRRNHRIEDLEKTVRILKQKYPEYSQAADTYLSGPKAYFCNMFIFPKETFFRYAEWIFDILFAFEAETDLSEKRLFISEWLTGIFIQKLIQEKARGVFVPTIYAESERIIPIALAADENYAVPMSVTIASILRNAKPKTKYDIYILASDDFSPASKALLLKFEERYPGCKINFFDIKEIFDDAHLEIAHITKTAYNRLLLPSLLPQYSKCIYLDTDVIVNTDLTNLYRTNVDDYYTAGVKAAGYIYPERKNAQETERLHLPSVDNYINSGVMVMNLDKLRKHGLEKTFVEMSAKFHDQDVINICCYNNIKILPLTFNLMTKYICRKNGRYLVNEIGEHVYPVDERKAALERPVIVHFADRKKPWNDRNCPLGEYWWKYVPYSTFYFEQLHRGPDTKDKEDIAYLQREIKDIESSVSFRIGRMITYIPRKMIGGIKCCAESGIVYTFKYAVGKLVSRFRK